jgi:hypothetical protein
MLVRDLGSGPWVCRRVGWSTDIHISSAALLSTLSYMDTPRLCAAGSIESCGQRWLLSYVNHG